MSTPKKSRPARAAKPAEPRSVAVKAATAATAAVTTAAVKKTAARKPAAAKPAAPKQPPVRRGRGRPARLSKAAIVEEALGLLATRSPEELTLTAVAARMGTATMSLYNYFPNHDALLNAVADHAFSLFEPPRIRAGQSWQDALLAWLWALQQHFTRYPVVLKVISLEGQLATAWLKINAPLIRVLRNAGFEGAGLAFASGWFVTEAIGMIMMELFAPAFRRPLALSHLAELETDDQAIFLELRPHLTGIDNRRVLDFSFHQLINGLERLLADPAAPGAKTRRRAPKTGA